MGRHSWHHAIPGCAASPERQTALTRSEAQPEQRCWKRRATLSRLFAAPATPPARSLREW
eukprot:3589918-Lingulodinium_polyedra.AAC.1